MPMNNNGFSVRDLAINVWQKVNRPTYTRTLSVLALLIVVVAVPLTVYISGQNQDLRQRASYNGQWCDPNSITACSSACSSGACIDNACTNVAPVNEGGNCLINGSSGTCQNGTCTQSPTNTPTNTPTPTPTSPPSSSNCPPAGSNYFQCTDGTPGLEGKTIGNPDGTCTDPATGKTCPQYVRWQCDGNPNGNHQGYCDDNCDIASA